MPTDLLPGEELMCGALKPGEDVDWLRRDRGGYGFISRFRVTVIKVHESGRVTIRANGRTAIVQRQSLAEVEATNAR